MGNIESVSKEYTNEQLKQTEKQDTQLLSNWNEKFTFDDNFVAVKYLQELESNTGQFQLDIDKLNKTKRDRDKWNNTNAAVASCWSDLHFWSQKDLKFIKKELQSLSSLGNASYSNLLELRLQVLTRLQLALYRRDKRSKLVQLLTSEEKQMQMKAEFVMNLFANSNNGKVADEVLSRLAELPNVSNLLYVDEEKTEEEIAKLKQDKMDIDTEQKREEEIVDERYDQLFPKSLLSFLLSVVADETKQQLQNVRQDSPLPESSTTSVSPALKFLQLLQRDIIYQASCSPNAASKATRTLWLYTRQVLQYSLDVLDQALKVNCLCFGGTSTSMVVDNLKDSNGTSVVLNFRVERILKESLLGQLLPPLATALCLMVSRTDHSSFFVELLTLLTPLLSILDQTCQSSSDCKAAENNHQDRLRLATQVQSPVEVESPHNYYPNTDEERVVHIPGATHLYITFDPQCSTDQGQDFLQLYRQPNKTEPILTPFSGRSDNWPKIPLIVQGDQVFFYFHSAPFASYWGYRCLVTGLVLEGSNIWMYDLMRTVGHLFRRTLRKAIIGDISASEKDHESWLDSQLFRGSVQSLTQEESLFIDDFISCKEGTIAQQVIAYMEKKITPNPAIDRIGGPNIAACIRAFILAMIKHLGLLPVLQNMDRLKENEEQMLKIWTEGRKLRQWIGGERRRILLEQEAKKEEQREEGVVAEPTKELDTSSYEYFSNDIMSKMTFLLQLEPAYGIASGIVEIPAETFAESKSKKRARANLRASQESSLQTWKDLFVAWRTVQKVAQKPRKDDKQESIPELISTFIKKGSVDTLKSLIARRVNRATIRANAFNTIEDLLATLKTASLRQDIASILCNSLRSLQDSEGYGHYSCNIKGSGLSNEANVKKAFFRLYNSIVNIVKDPECDTIMRRIAVDALCVSYRPEDHEFLLHVVPPLHRIMTSPAEDSKLKRLCGLAFKYLSLHTVGGLRERSEPELVLQLDPLQNYVIEAIFSDIEKATVTFIQKKTEVLLPNEDSKTINMYHKDEKFLYEALLLFHALTQTIACESYLASAKVIHLLLQIHHSATPRNQRLALRMLRKILPTVPPSTFSTLDLQLDFLVKDKDQATRLIQYFLELIGHTLLVEPTASLERVPPSQDYRTGQVQFSLAAELVMLLRFLVANAEPWGRVISQAIGQSLKAIPSLVRSDCTPNMKDIKSALASLSVIGGHTDKMRVGGRVEIKSTKERGTLVDYDRLSSLCKVVIDTNLKKVIECDREKLYAIPEVPFDSSKFALTAELIPSFSIFTVPSASSAVSKETKTIAAEPTPITNEIEMEKVEDTWQCSICTLINKASVTSCSICGNTRPRAGEPADAPHATTWYCGDCTLENEPSARSCVVCGSPNPSFVEKQPQTMVIDTEVKTTEEVMQDVPDDTAANVDLVFHALRSRALKALSVLLQARESAMSFFKEGGLALLNMAVRPTELDEFRSVEQLETKEERLWELLYQTKHNIREDTMQKQLTQVDALKHSPFSKLPIILPSSLDRGSAKRIVFPSGDLTVVTRGKVSFEDEFGLVRANNVIPNSLPAYYFEIKLTSDVSSNLRVALGLYREGTELEGLPGNSNSYTYQGDRGQLCHNVGSLRASRIVERDYGPSFGSGDVIGCGWNLKTSTVWFTKNGEFLGNGFDKVAGRFYPCIWLGAEVQAQVNFGQLPFTFNFVKTLPPEFLSSLSEAEKTTKGMGATEIRRRTQAEELKLMMDIFPLELCIIALEKCKDDMQYAANWLIENGFKELERMSNEIINRSIREGKEKEEKEMMHAIMEEQRALGQFVDQPEEHVTTNEDTEGEENEDDEDDDDDREPSSRFLDDELGVDAPVQIERNPRTTTADDMRIEDVLPGMLLSVASANTGIEIIDTTGRTGVVTEVDLNSMRVKLRFFDAETSSLHSFWFQFQMLKKPASMYQDPCSEFKGADISKLMQGVATVETALSVLRARRTVLGLLSEWASFPFEELCLSEPQSVIDLLKLAACEYLSSGTDLGKNESSAILKSFHDKFVAALHKEEKIQPKPLRIGNKTTSDNSNSVPLTQVLTEECIKHFMAAVEAPLPIVTEESPHPYENNQEVRKKFHIKGASKLIIRFDANCNVHRSDPLTRCSFYRDEEYQDNIVTYRGSVGGNQFQTLIVNSDKVFFRFTSGAGETYWGYKFTITPLTLRLNDTQALSGLNFELGYWLLELLLENCPVHVRKMYTRDLYDALVFYIRSSKRSAKARGIQLLMKVLQELQLQGTPVDLTPILKMRSSMERRYYLESQESRPVYSAHLQGLIELLTTAKLTEQALDVPKSLDVVGNITVPLNDLFTKKIRITRAKYGVLNNSKLSVDITESIQQVVDQQFGGSYLIIPAKHSNVPYLTDVAPGKEKKLLICYDIVEIGSGKLIDRSQRTVANGQSLVLKTESRFNDVLEVTSLAHSLVRTGTFTNNLIVDTWLLDKIRKAHLSVVESLNLTPSTGTIVSLPGPFISFSIVLWMKLEASASTLGQIRTIFLKGYDAESSRNPALLYDSEKKTLQLVISTSRDWLETLQSQQEIPIDTWVHVVCWCDGKHARLYVNGKLDVERQMKGRIVYNSDPLFINKAPSGVLNADTAYNGIQGVIKKMRIFQRPLSESEIQILANPQEINEAPEKPVMISTKDLPSALQINTKWTPAMNEQLVELVAQICDETDRDIFAIDVQYIEPSSQLSRFPLLVGIPAEQLQFRFSAIRALNLRLASIFPLVDFSQCHLSWSLAHAIANLKGTIFLQTKLHIWNKILANTVSNKGRPSITISRPRALKAKEKGDPEGKYSVFGQMFRQLHFLPPASLRRTGQMWSVVYSGEGGQDAGGLFRDSISHACSDLQSPYVPLFIPCPNSKGFGDNQEKWIPNAASSSSLHLSMYSFVGKLMGVALRGKHTLNLDLPSIVWKQLVGSEITRYDLEAIDAFSYKVFDQVMNAENQEGVNEDTFGDLIDLNFTTTSTDGREIELIEGGKDIKVTWYNRHEYVALMEKYRLNEFRAQVEAIKNGLATIVPIQLLSLFTWQELELSVCGKREVSLELLKQNTKYSGYVKTDKTVELFWEVMEQFTTKEKELFLRFVWGRSRLPLTSEDFEQKFVLMTAPDNSDETLPISHTCFFQLELPRYTSSDVLKRKLLYAITECREIDTDHAAQNVDWDREDE